MSGQTFALCRMFVIFDQKRTLLKKTCTDDQLKGIVFSLGIRYIGM